MEATIQANAPVLGMRRGDPPQRVELTEFIERVAANGKITILERHCTAVESILEEDSGEPATTGARDTPASEPAVQSGASEAPAGDQAAGQAGEVSGPDRADRPEGSGNASASVSRPRRSRKKPDPDPEES